MTFDFCFAPANGRTAFLPLPLLLLPAMLTWLAVTGQGRRGKENEEPAWHVTWPWLKAVQIICTFVKKL